MEKDKPPRRGKVYKFWLLKPPVSVGRPEQVLPLLGAISVGLIGLIVVCLAVAISGDLAGLFLLIIIAPLHILFLMVCSDLRQLYLLQKDKGMPGQWIIQA